MRRKRGIRAPHVKDLTCDLTFSIIYPYAEYPQNMVALSAFQRAVRFSRLQKSFGTKQTYSTASKLDVEKLLSTPSWSVTSLLPSTKSDHDAPEVSSKQLHHLLRLSALPSPKDAAEEEKMLSTLSSQLHFVKDIQAVDTTGVKPLKSLRDETAEGEKEAEFGLDAMKDVLAMEDVRGKHHKRIRRRRETSTESKEAVNWDILGHASKKVGRYFVVEGGKDK